MSTSPDNLPEEPTPEQLERARKHTIIIYVAMIVMVLLPFVVYFFTK
ncbi:MAG: hypothetical protein LR015_03355 [Verrucomicrobia bacterium]|nr:hypothetical protein [Verrucomicrobiota bacterium]